ncbi:elongation factor P hydroxylase [Paraglaciecola arctica]|uniref:elongation factor P hydroxylase n=1 Tax=Paraglaciecola arctica TaxID=1128911 RepID=UPI001C06B7B0|nr:elongation factor P hydroxylase [Paraglaciecola arctica]MBU3004034.1 elongation factor P hydroxylase [Paraglaciecola arctica]
MNEYLTETSEQTFSTLSLAQSNVHNYQDLIDLFNATFSKTENTVLVKGAHEPIYIPASVKHQSHRIVFAHGYFASALHEIAHWCIAGKKRRLLEDYGYWYNPDGRDAIQQAEFEKVEVKPQAIEWAFSCAAGKSFRVSTDNLNGAPVNVQGFQEAVKLQVMQYVEYGFPPRAAEFIKVLQRFYQTRELDLGAFADESK